VAGHDEGKRLVKGSIPMTSLLLVFLGGGIGASARHGVNVAVLRALGPGFPWATLIVNVTGSILMGLLAGYLAFRPGGGLTQHARIFLATGVLGGYTTFSAFSMDAALLMERGATGQALLYVLGSVVLSILGLFAGLWLVRALT
jgi:CrcB protein